MYYTNGTNNYNVGTVTRTSGTSTYYGPIVGGAQLGMASFSNNYYLNTSCDRTSSLGTSSTEAQMKDASFPATLGAKFRADVTPNINNGYPILNWQTDAPMDKPGPGTGGGGGGGEVPAVYTLMYMDGETYIASYALREGDNHIIRAGLQKDGFKFTGWSYNGVTYLPATSFSMPANDVTMGYLVRAPPNEYYYEAHYAVGTPSDYDVFTVVAGTAPQAHRTIRARRSRCVKPNYAIINTDPFVVQPHNENLFIIYCAQGISTAEQFNAIRNNLGGTYFLLNDISLSGYLTGHL